MARPPRCRRVCEEPAYDGFAPIGTESGEPVMLTVDEYEVLRLIDLEKLTHEQCGAQIGVARTTVTDIYETAREKLADSLVNGKRLIISGGSYILCGGSGHCFRRGGCKKANRTYAAPALPEKGENTMRIAVTYEDGNVYQHFGHTEKFMICDVTDGNITQKTLVDTDGSGHGALADLLGRLGAEVLICGGIGGGAQSALSEAGIKLYGGVSGSCEEAVRALLAGTLAYRERATCDHHGHEHGEGHRCGEHGCKEHGCH